jgi:hypothetical protein
MNHTKHTQGPLTVCEKLSGSENHKGFTLRTNDGFCVAEINPGDENGDLGRANAERIKATYEACTGMTDPEKEVAELKALREAVLNGGPTPLTHIMRWVADRFVNVYGEKEWTDFVLTLRERADKIEAAIKNAGGKQ